MSKDNLQLVKELRARSGAAIMSCKKALEEAKGNLELAIEWLKKQGLATAAKKAGRETAEGAVGVLQYDNKVLLAELNSETDFVAKNNKFHSLMNELLEDMKGFRKDLQKDFIEFKDQISSKISESVATIGENIRLNRVNSLDVAEGEVLGIYIHGRSHSNMGKIAVAVTIQDNKTQSDVEQLKELAKKLAMHIAASKPEVIFAEEIEREVIDKERDIIIERMKKEGIAIEDTTIEKEVKKFYDDVVLMNQIFAFDSKLSVKDLLEQKNVKVIKFIRFAVGE